MVKPLSSPLSGLASASFYIKWLFPVSNVASVWVPQFYERWRTWLKVKASKLCVSGRVHSTIVSIGKASNTGIEREGIGRSRTARAIGKSESFLHCPIKTFVPLVS